MDGAGGRGRRCEYVELLRLVDKLDVNDRTHAVAVANLHTNVIKIQAMISG